VTLTTPGPVPRHAPPPRRPVGCAVCCNR
jgi:hypothetical protein